MNYVFPAPEVVSLPVVGSDDRFPVRRVYCVGRNYAEHAKEMGFTGREDPFFFCKPANGLLPIADGETGQMPYPSKTNDLHHEMELVVAIGKAGKDVSVEEAKEMVWGYALGLDMTRRDLQGEAKKQGRPWEVGKAFDMSGPIGPIHPAASVSNIDKAAISLDVNGQTRQKSTIASLIWSIPESVAFLSGLFELQPGDLIFSGTPEGVAAVKVGDELVGKVEGLGELKVRIV